MSEPRAIFFDMDGTILDWRSGMEESWLASCEAHADGGLFVPTALHDAIAKRRTWFWDDQQRALAGRMDLDGASREIVRRAFEDLGLARDDLAHRIADDYRRRRLEIMAPYPGAIDVLATLRARGVAMALITNGNAVSQRHSVERFGLAQYFDCVIIEGEFGVGKPDERVFRHALASCDVEPAETWMVGDSLEADIVKPLELGLHTVWIDEQGQGLPYDDHPRPHRIVKAITELT
jgi:putative hydrolase of the HAD superfamily